MNRKNLKVLLVIDECNPDWASVPLEGYRYYEGIRQFVDVTLVTHERNREALEKQRGDHEIIYISESRFISTYFKWISKIAASGKINWPLYNALGYPIYAEFNHRTFEMFKQKIVHGEYDLLHVLTPMMPRYPVKLVQLQQYAPLLLGPVNGGVPFPKGFTKVARQENAYLNFLRVIGRHVIPGYIQTYKQASKILAGSTHTMNMLKRVFSITDDRIELFYENGITNDFLAPVQRVDDDRKVQLLFVGRLVPYKCADVVIDALVNLEPSVRDRLHLTIVGDGQERSALEQQVKQSGLEPMVTFTGWIKQHETVEYYKKSDIFCFPSIREFGGAVVLEAMACGLPCIVANNGGIGEYVTETTGFSIEPVSRSYLVQEMAKHIRQLVENPDLRQQMSANSIERVRQFEWTEKARKIVSIYEDLLSSRPSVREPELQSKTVSV